MKYNDQELIELDPDKWDGHVREMLVWNDSHAYSDEPYKTKIVYCQTSDEAKVCRWMDFMGMTFSHAAEIPIPIKPGEGFCIAYNYVHGDEKTVTQPRRATWRELSRWYAEGHGEVAYPNGGYNVSNEIHYDSDDSNKPCKEGLYVRKWDDSEWHKPTVDYMGIA